MAEEKQGRVNPYTGYYAHDADCPAPPVVTPADRIGQPPSDAVVLFDGSHTDSWRKRDGSAIDWKLDQGELEVVPGTGDIWTRETFGSVQLHLEFASPAVVDGHGQKRGNSGVFFHDSYEVQILDNYENPTYSDGVVGAIYGQYPPLANAIRPPAEWNSYDILFTSPKFEGSRLVKPAYLTVLLNGIVVQNHAEILGSTLIKHGEIAVYQPHPEKGSIRLQDHKDLVRFRNIWARSIPES